MRVGTYAVASSLAIAGLASFEVAAQPAAVEWSAAAKLQRGNCGSGIVATIVEQAGALTIRFARPAGYEGGQGSQIQVALAPDGSAKTEFRGAYGPTIIEIPAGKGRRSFTTTQIQGACQWRYEPR